MNQWVTVLVTGTASLVVSDIRITSHWYSAGRKYQCVENNSVPRYVSVKVICQPCMGAIASLSLCKNAVWLKCMANATHYPACYCADIHSILHIYSNIFSFRMYHRTCLFHTCYIITVSQINLVYFFLWISWPVLRESRDILTHSLNFSHPGCVIRAFLNPWLHPYAP